MSVIVKGMDMPRSCFDCGLMQFDEMGDEYCAYVYGKGKHYLDNDVEKDRPDWCPLVELPEKHGRLIDGDMLKAEIEEMAGYDEAEQFNDYYLCEQPVILEAEGSE